jgi:hypothetical protein
MNKWRDDMTLKEIAQALVDGCKVGKARENLDALYAAETVGLAGIHGKHDWWDNAFTTHGLTVEGPFIHGDDRFAVIFGMDTTDNATGERRQGQEVGVYHVKGGKIVKEEFFYSI